MPYTYDTADWKNLVEKSLAATEAGNLTWEQDENYSSDSNAFHFLAHKGPTTLGLFGRRRGFSYQMSFSREVEGDEVSGDKIKVTNKRAAEGIPFDLLFRAVREQVRLAALEAEKQAESATLALVLESIDTGVALDEERQLSLVPLTSHNNWDTVISRLITATREGAVKWVLDNQSGGHVYTVERGTFTYLVEKDARPDNGFVLWIDVGEGDLCSTQQWDDSLLETLAELIGLPTRIAEAQFEKIAKAALFEDVLKDLESEKGSR
ncbi:hypothetical protein [Arthrobacter sp. zg-Y179]|uniref:hypothetical protein n=1 Tax=Arthrobacter sp. zg-Y179 TaxID=2894188 RepID=UPI001E531415|nr:hypothetical protein [Arthrobacter sp. zg-Y179]MCC9175461.1 hypothetical protein [Arthrobacter sp. zg-Y179]